MDADPKLMLNQKLTAKAFGVSVQAFQTWSLRPHSRKGRQVFYYLPSVIEQRLAQLMDRAEAFDSQRERLAAAQAEKVEAENAVRRGKLADVDEVEELIGGRIVAAKQKLRGVSAKVAPQLTNVADASIIAGLIRAEIDGALADLAAGRG
jgi:hypothetical protein